VQLKWASTFGTCLCFTIIVLGVGYNQSLQKCLLETQAGVHWQSTGNHFGACFLNKARENQLVATRVTTLVRASGLLGVRE